MELKKIFLITTFILTVVHLNCKNEDKNKTDSLPEPSGNKNELVNYDSPVSFVKKQIDDSLEFFLIDFLVPNIDLMYQLAYSGSKDDNFINFKKQLKNNFNFLTEEDLLSWDNILLRTKSLLSEKKSKYGIEYWTITLNNGHRFPTVVIYEIIKKAEAKPPVKEMSDFWELDFSNLFNSNTTFSVDYAKEPLIYTYEIWLQKKRQESLLDGMTFKDSHKIILFVDDADPLSEKQTLIHEFSHIFFEMKTSHLTNFELENYVLDVVQGFNTGAQTTVSFNYNEFNELIAKLSELIVLPDDKLYEFVKEISINKMPHYQMARQLISSTTVYKFLSDEHPDQFLKLQTREITDEEVDRCLYGMSLETTETGKNKLRSYLEYQVSGVSKTLEDVVFK